MNESMNGWQTDRPKTIALHTPEFWFNNDETWPGCLSGQYLGQVWHLVHQHYAEVTPYPIHRLGRGTSGIVLMAKSKPARAKLSQQMREGKITKIYRALVGQGDIPDNFTINQAIGKIALSNNYRSRGQLWSIFTREYSTNQSRCLLLYTQ